MLVNSRVRRSMEVVCKSSDLEDLYGTQICFATVIQYCTL